MSKSKRNRNSKKSSYETSLQAKGRFENESSESKRSSGLFVSLRNHLWLTALVAYLSIGAVGAVLKYLEEDAQRQKVLPAKERSALSAINPFVPAPPPSPTPQLSKENIYAGSRLLSVV